MLRGKWLFSGRTFCAWRFAFFSCWIEEVTMCWGIMVETLNAYHIIMAEIWRPDSLFTDWHLNIVKHQSLAKFQKKLFTNSIETCDIKNHGELWLIHALQTKCSICSQDSLAKKRVPDELSRTSSELLFARKKSKNNAWRFCIENRIRARTHLVIDESFPHELL